MNQRLKKLGAESPTDPQVNVPVVADSGSSELLQTLVPSHSTTLCQDCTNKRINALLGVYPNIVELTRLRASLPDSCGTCFPETIKSGGAMIRKYTWNPQKRCYQNPDLVDFDGE